MSNNILYLVATPIGNLSDISQRAHTILETVDFIAAEDTRVTQKLLSHLGIQKQMVSYYEHNRRQRGQEIIARLLAGESCALVTDAGTPAISDPGEDLVALCHENGITVTPVPGACAAACALAASGLPSGRWCFEGFVSVNKKARQAHLALVENEIRTMIFYEAPHKLRATLRDFAKVFGEDRPMSFAREMTKLHEEIKRMTVGEAVSYFEEHQPRGEFVLIVQGKAAETEEEDGSKMQAALAEVHSRMERGETRKDAVKFASAAHGVKKNALYELALVEAE